MSDHSTAIANTQPQRTSTPLASAPEFDLLLACARTSPDISRVQSLIHSGIDWSVFSALAAIRGVRTLVFHSLREICWDQIPAGIQSEWSQTARLLTAKSLFITGEILRIAAEFRSAGIPVAVLKGSVFAQLAYGDPSFREFSDLDLLLHPTDIDRSIPIFERLGYRPVWNRDIAYITGFLGNVGECNLFNPLLGAAIDLHWRVSTRATALAPSLSDFPSGFQPVILAGSAVLSLALADLPLYLAAQGGGDQWCDLRRLCDLAEFLRRYPDLDWQPSLAAAQRLGGLRSMLTGIELASRLLDAPVPAPAVPLIQRDPAIARLATHAAHRLRHGHSPGEAVSRYLFQLRSKEGLIGKLTLAWRIFIERTAEDAWVMLPRPLWWLYSLLRPLRMSAKLLRRVAANRLGSLSWTY